MKKSKTFAAMALAAILACSSAVPAFAAEVTEGETAHAGTNISVVKENPAPIFTVGIPAEVTITSAEPASLVFTMNEECLKTVPEGKKVSVSIADAGYGDVTGKFALYSDTAAAEAAYGVYPSKYSLRDSDKYEIGDLLASFYGNEKVTDGQASVSRVIKVNDYDNLEAGSYAGTITFNIDVRAQ
ncbi:MAG: hypothetical protein Q4F21_10140 [Lachnospiraceae bacterium]|nr:hypothetical protein [Lachnospiraceae bacterium]